MEAKVARNADEAMELGVAYREPTMEEKGRYGVKHGVWDWTTETEWRPYPIQAKDKGAFDPKNPGLGKVYVPTPLHPSVAQNQLIAEIIPAVAEAVARANQSIASPAGMDPALWDKFQQFLAWEKASEVVGGVGQDGQGSLSGLGEKRGPGRPPKTAA